jgi:hypothetical protein
MQGAPCQRRNEQRRGSGCSRFAEPVLDILAGSDATRIARPSRRSLALVLSGRVDVFDCAPTARHQRDLWRSRSRDCAPPEPRRQTVSTAKSAVPMQSTANQRARARRFGLPLLGVVMCLSAVLPAAALMAPNAEARASASCSGWTSTTTPPPSIRVYRRHSGRVDVVNFRKYVVTVMGKEWPGYLPYQLILAGAVAVKQYGWFHAMQGHQRMTRSGRCYDVTDGTGDQLYKPGRARIRSKHRTAVDATWATTLTKKGTFFMTGYRRGDNVRCGRDANGYKLFARSGTKCANAGKSWRDILFIYYQPRLDIRD